MINNIFILFFFFFSFDGFKNHLILGAKDLIDSFLFDVLKLCEFLFLNKEESVKKIFYEYI